MKHKTMNWRTFLVNSGYLLCLFAMAFIGAGLVPALILTAFVMVAEVLVEYYEHVHPDTASDSEQAYRRLDNFMVYCSPRSIRQSKSVRIALCRTALLVMFWPGLLLFPIMRRLDRFARHTEA